eukprot:scaffold3782_cov301-Prasinococcus_capsulatus_cf.AAC.2
MSNDNLVRQRWNADANASAARRPGRRDEVPHGEASRPFPDGPERGGGRSVWGSSAAPLGRGAAAGRPGAPVGAAFVPYRERRGAGSRTRGGRNSEINQLLNSGTARRPALLAEPAPPAALMVPPPDRPPQRASERGRGVAGRTVVATRRDATRRDETRGAGRRGEETGGEARRREERIGEERRGEERRCSPR